MNRTTRMSYGVWGKEEEQEEGGGGGWEGILALCCSNTKACLTLRE